jgi:hypothetical protein
VSRFYDIDPGDPEAPVEMARYDGPRGPIKPGDLVAYANYAMPGLTDSGGLLAVEEIISFGEDAPPLAVLTHQRSGELWEVSANTLTPVSPVDGTMAKLPDMRLSLILILAKYLAAAGDAQLAGQYTVLPGALALHVLALDGDLATGCALPTRWAADGTARDDDRPTRTVPLPGDGNAGADRALGAWARANAEVIRQAFTDATAYRDQYGLDPAGPRDYGRLAGQYGEMVVGP